MADPLLAAQHFLWLAVSVPLYEATLTGDDERFTPAELERFADEGVRVFLAAYSRQRPKRSRAKARGGSGPDSKPGHSRKPRPRKCSSNLVGLICP